MVLVQSQISYYKPRQAFLGLPFTFVTFFVLKDFQPQNLASNQIICNNVKKFMLGYIYIQHFSQTYHFIASRMTFSVFFLALVWLFLPSGKIFYFFVRFYCYVVIHIYIYICIYIFMIWKSLEFLRVNLILTSCHLLLNRFLPIGWTSY